MEIRVIVFGNCFDIETKFEQCGERAEWVPIAEGLTAHQCRKELKVLLDNTQALLDSLTAPPKGKQR